MSATVWIIDDEADSRSGMAELLRTRAFRVIEHEHGRAALDYLLSGDAEQPAVIILDLAMPVMSGWEFLAIVKSYYRTSRIPLIVVSGKEAPDLAMRHGVVDMFLPKPISPERLADSVASFLRQSTRLRLVSSAP